MLTKQIFISFQILVSPAQSCDSFDERSFIHHVSSLSSLSFHFHFCSLGHATLWRIIQFSQGLSDIQFRQRSTCTTYCISGITSAFYMHYLLYFRYNLEPVVAEALSGGRKYPPRLFLMPAKSFWQLARCYPRGRFSITFIYQQRNLKNL